MRGGREAVAAAAGEERGGFMLVCNCDSLVGGGGDSTCAIMGGVMGGDDRIDHLLARRQRYTVEPALRLEKKSRMLCAGSVGGRSPRE